MMNDAEDPFLLDKLASTNLQAKERQKAYMINLLNNVADLIGGYKSNNIQPVVTKLQEKGISSHSLKLACEKIIDRFDRFPSFREIKSMCHECEVKQLEDDGTCTQAAFDRRKQEGLRKMFLLRATEEQLENYVKWWLKENFNLHGKEAMIQADVKAFEMCALFDWHDSFYRFDLEAIKSICSKKNKLSQEKKLQKIEFNSSREWEKYI